MKSPFSRYWATRALLAPDWMHILHTVIRRGLYETRWLPDFLQRLKAVVRVVRGYLATAVVGS